MNIKKKLEILAGAAKYDVSCASSGSRRENRGGRLGSATPSGICHSFTEDGRCVSLLKVLFTNFCVYDCAYCANRASNDIPRAAFTPAGQSTQLIIGASPESDYDILHLAGSLYRKQALKRVNIPATSPSTPPTPDCRNCRNRPWAGKTGSTRPIG